MTSVITIHDDRPKVGLSNLKVVLATIDITSYTTDGEALTAVLLGLGAIDKVFVSSSEKGYMAAWDEANAKLKVMTAAATQAASTTDCGTFELLVLGTG